MGIHEYAVEERATSDLLHQYDRDGIRIGSLERSRATGHTTQSWKGADSTTWEISSASGCLSRDGACVASEPAAIDANELGLTVGQVELAGRRAIAAHTDLDAFLHPGETPNPFASLPGKDGSHAARECVVVIDVACSTAAYCWAYGGDSDCGWITTKCCFE